MSIKKPETYGYKVCPYFNNNTFECSATADMFGLDQGQNLTMHKGKAVVYPNGFCNAHIFECSVFSSIRDNTELGEHDVPCENESEMISESEVKEIFRREYLWIKKLLDLSIEEYKEFLSNPIKIEDYRNFSALVDKTSDFYNTISHFNVIINQLKHVYNSIFGEDILVTFNE